MAGRERDVVATGRGRASERRSRPRASLFAGDVAAARFMHTSVSDGYIGAGLILFLIEPRMHLSLRSFAAAASVALVLPSTIVGAQAAASGTATPVQSAPISGVRYEVTFDATTARARTLRVGMTFDVGGTGAVLLSLPAWTPGAYEISNFARWISNFGATSGGKALAWDKLDFDTW